MDSLASVELVSVLGHPTYRIGYFTAGKRRVQLADALTGELRPPLSREEALRVAISEFAPRSPVRTVEYLTAEDVGRHHEYREQPLPAWAVSFDHPSGATAYVAAEAGTLVRIRSGTWRTFDFFWMLHTMDYQGRDNFNNWVLRAFSVLGLVTVGSGFILFGLTSRLQLRAAHRRIASRTQGRPYRKPALSPADVLAHLQRRGLQVPDPLRALHALEYIGYYRLLIYMRPLQQLGPPKTFVAGASFDDVLALYEFDASYVSSAWMGSSASRWRSGRRS